MMKTKVLKSSILLQLVLVGLLISFSTSCSNELGLQEDKKEISTESISERFVDNMLEVYQLEVENGTNYGMSEYFSSMSIVDKNGDPILFNDMGKDEQNILLQAWRKKRVDQYNDIASSSNDNAASLWAQSQALSNVLNKSRSSGVSSFNPEELLKEFNAATEKSREMKFKLDSKRGGTTGRRMSGIAAMRRYYGKGRILYTKWSNGYDGKDLLTSLSNSSSANTSLDWVGNLLNLGHTSLCEYSSWNRGWESNSSNAKITLSSWGNEDYKYLGYSGKTVGREFARFWLNKIPQVKMPVFSIHRAVNEVWVWDWFNSGFRYYPANSTESQRAVDYARKQIGKPYNFSFHDKWRTDSFYCSQLVWKSWYSVNRKYDMDWNAILPWVSPSDITGSADCQPLVDAKN